MKPSSHPPKNYVEGQKKSLEVRRKKATRHNIMIWDAIWFYALTEKLRTLKQFANALNYEGLKTSSGKNWTTGTVSHVFKAHGKTPKSLIDGITKPPPYERPKELPY